MASYEVLTTDGRRWEIARPLPVFGAHAEYPATPRGLSREDSSSGWVVLSRNIVAYRLLPEVDS